jgi:hypothetical protein
LLDTSLSSRIYCFRADYVVSSEFNRGKIPAWLALETDWRGYRIHTLPWVVDVARVLGLLSIEDTLDDWIDYLQSLGLQAIVAIDSEEFFEDKFSSGC